MDTRCSHCKQIIQQPSVDDDLNAEFTSDRRTAFSCRVCGKRFDGPLKLCFNPTQREPAEQNPADDHSEPVVHLTRPTAPPRVVPTSCYRSESTRNGMDMTPYPTLAISWDEADDVSLASSMGRRDRPELTITPATGLASVTEPLSLS